METLKFVKNLLPSFIVSTSYEQYIKALCNVTSFPFENCYYTGLNLDKYKINKEEVEKIRKFKDSIVKNPEFENLEQIFWEELPKMDIYSLLDDIHPVGGEAKKEAVMDIMHKFNLHASDLIYIGDSITDVEPLRFANENDGLAISFNGNEYAIDEASVAVISDNTLIISILTDLFRREGTDDVLEFVNSYKDNPKKSFKTHSINKKLAEKLSETFTNLEIVTCDNVENIKAESSEFRKKMRGEAIGGLG
jgi:energy-converting hydrogenase A subunit R